MVQAETTIKIVTNIDNTHKGTQWIQIKCYRNYHQGIITLGIDHSDERTDPEIRLSS